MKASFRMAHLLGALLALAGWCTGQEAAAAPGGLVFLRFAGELEPGMRSHLERALDQARERGARLVIELDTPGGEIELMRELAQRIEDAPQQDGVSTAAWIDGQAWSAGALLALSCEKLYMRPGSSIGSATPVQLGINEQGALELVPVSEDPAIREKFTSAFRAEFRGHAERHGRPGALAEAMVDPKVGVRLVDLAGERVLLTETEWNDGLGRGADMVLIRTVADTETTLNLTASEAVELGLADGLAEDREELSALLGASPGSSFEVLREASDEFARLASQWGSALLLLGLVLAFIELKTPGFGLAGGGSIACFALLLAGRYLSGLANVAEILAVAAGLILVSVEVFLMPGALWPGILGTLLAVWGLFASEMPPGFTLLSEAGRERALDGGFQLLLSVSIAVVAMMLLSRFLPKTPVARRMVLAGGPAGSAFGAALQPAGSGVKATVAAGALGRALTPLRPVGKVALDAHPGAQFEASSSGLALERGARVRVVSSAGERLLVEEQGSL